MVEPREHPLQQVRRPRLPPELRGRVLDVAARAASTSRPDDAWVDALWRSHLWRWSLAGALAALAAGHLVLQRLAPPIPAAYFASGGASLQELALVRVVVDGRGSGHVGVVELLEAAAGELP